jgi:hypothetical protein
MKNNSDKKKTQKKNKRILGRTKQILSEKRLTQKKTG